MNIGIACYSSIGGSGVLAAELGKKLSAKGHVVHFISDGIPFRLKNDRGENIFVHQVNMRNLNENRPDFFEIRLASTIAEVVTKHSLEILHVHYAVPFAVSAVLARDMCPKNNVRLVTTLHGTDITVYGRDPNFYPAIQLGLEKSDLITAVSQSLSEEAQRLFKLQGRIATIYNFVDTTHFDRHNVLNIRECLAPKTSPILVHVSNFRPVKRVPDVIRVFAGIRQNRRATLILVGDGPDRGHAQSLVRELGLEADVIFLGPQLDVRWILSISDVMLLASELESFGLAAIEAMACETPVVAPAVGGLPEVVSHGATGFLTEVGNIQAMIRYTNLLLDDMMLHREFALAGRRRVEEHFSSDGQVLKYERLFRNVLTQEMVNTRI